jgi:hypothetical protein
MDDGNSQTVIDTSQTNTDPNTAVNPNPGSVDTTDYNPTTISQWWDIQQAVGGTPNFATFPWGQAAATMLGGPGGGVGAGLALGLGALAAALSRQQAPTIRAPEYKSAPIYNRALTAPLLPPQPAPEKSPSGQNIYRPMVGMPLFFNPNPFQFDATEAAKRYGPTPEQIASGRAGYEAGLASLYKPLTITPFTYASTVTGATGNDTVAGGNSTVTGSTGTDTVAGGAAGGSVEDIMVGYSGGGYNQGGDVYMAAGRYLSGGGDGMSDSIPATINDKQPARLADGEFVVPADVVADLGNGSSNAGAKKLYAMMKKIRQARHGTSKQPPEVKAESAMPR